MEDHLMRIIIANIHIFVHIDQLWSIKGQLEDVDFGLLGDMLEDVQFIGRSYLYRVGIGRNTKAAVAAKPLMLD